MVELILHNGACGHLLPGWSKTLLKSLEERNLQMIADVLRPGKFMRSCTVILKQKLLGIPKFKEFQINIPVLIQKCVQPKTSKYCKVNVSK